MSGPFSPTSPTPLAFFDPESWSWRTSQGCLLSAAPESLEPLPDWGTTSNGVLYEHRMPALLTAARDGSALLGTPTQMDAHGGQRSAEFRRGRTHTPVELAALLQTPTAWLGRRSSQAIGDPERWHDPERSNELSDQMAALLPTPQHWDHKVFGPNVDWKKRAESHADSVASVLMNLPLNDGSESSDDEHLTQLTTEDCDPSSSSG